MNSITQSRLHYLDLNPESENAIVLIHGLGATCDSWALQFDELCRSDFRVLAFDVPGFGKSDPISGGLSAWASRIAQCASAIQLTSYKLAGISMGGVLAQQIAIEYPETINKLVIINSYARLDFSKPQTWPYFLTRVILLHTLGLPVQAKAVARKVFPKPEQEMYRRVLIDQILQADPRSYRSAMHDLARFNSADRLHRIQAPTLVITGEQDSTVAPKIQSRLAQGIPNCRQVIIPDAGHAVSIDQYQEFNRILVDFLLN